MIGHLENYWKIQITWTGMNTFDPEEREKYWAPADRHAGHTGEQVRKAVGCNRTSWDKIEWDRTEEI